jgi:hypothetical protein
MPLLMRFFLLSYTNDLTGFSFHIFHGLDSSPRILVGRVIALLRVDKAASEDRISTDTYLERANPDE